MSAPAKERPAPSGEPDGPGGQPEHAVNVSRGTYRYSLGGAEWGRAVYQQQTSLTNDKYWHRRSDLPYVTARIVRRDGSGRRVGTDYLISATPDGAPSVITDDDLATGGWAVRLGANLSSDRDIITATGTAIRDAAHRTASEREATPRPDVHSESGHLDVPVAECLPDGYFKMPAQVTPEQARATWRELVAILAERPKMALTVGASAGAPYVGPMRRKSHWWDLHGYTSKGKSTTHAAAAAVWGDPRIGTGIVMGWNVSSIGAGRHLGQLGILPPFLDERGMPKFTPDDWGELIYNTSEGSSKLTAERLGPNTRRSSPWFGVLFSTGNAELTKGISAGRFAGIPARVIELKAPFTGGRAEADRITRDLLPRCYGWLGPEILRLYPVPAVRELIAQAEATVGVPEDGGVPGRLAEHLHMAVAGAAMIDAVLGTGSQLTDAATSAAVAYMTEHGDEPEHDADRLLDALAESLVSRRAAWPTASEFVELGLSRPLDMMAGAGRTQLAQHGYDQQSSGVRSDDGQWLYVFPATWHALAQSLGVDESTACAELYRRELLDVPAKARQERRWHSQARGAGVKLGRVYKVAVAGLDRGDDVDQVATPAPVLPTVTPAPAPCPTCAAAGTWCGFGAAAEEPAPCVVCGEPTRARSACGVARTASCPTGVPEPEAVAPATALQVPRPEPAGPVGPVVRRGAHPAAVARDDARSAASASAAAALAHGDPLRLLEALEGPYAPLRKDENGRMQAPYWRPPLPGITFAALVSTGWQWSRRYRGPVTVLDRSGAWVSSAASANVGHGALTHTGEDGDGWPGYYEVTVYRWAETGMPHPLGYVPAGAETVWIMAPTLGLLRDLVAAGRWPDASVLDSYTAAPVRINKWTGYVNELRATAITEYGRDSQQYVLVKEAFGQAMSLMIGSLSGQHREWKCGVHRPDWTHTIQAQGSATLWRWADDCRQVAAEHAPVALRNVDELVIPSAALDIVTTTPRPGSRSPLRIDPAGIALGSFKVKGTEEWGNP